MNRACEGVCPRWSRGSSSSAFYGVKSGRPADFFFGKIMPGQVLERATRPWACTNHICLGTGHLQTAVSTKMHYAFQNVNCKGQNCDQGLSMQAQEKAQRPFQRPSLSATLECITAAILTCPLFLNGNTVALRGEEALFQAFAF